MNLPAGARRPHRLPRHADGATYRAATLRSLRAADRAGQPETFLFNYTVRRNIA